MNIKLINYLLIWLFLALAESSCLCQNLHFTNFNYTHGLNLSKIKHFAVDSTGYLWLGSDNGLARFNGFGFEQFNPDSEDSKSVPGSYVTDIVVQESGQVIIAFDFDGVGFFDPVNKHFTVIDSFDNVLFKKEAAIALHKYDSTNLLIISGGGRAYKLNTNDRKISHFDIPYKINSFLNDPFNNDYCYLAGDYLWHYNKEDQSIVKVADYGGYGLLSDNLGHIYSSSYSNEIYQYNTRTKVQQVAKLQCDNFRIQKMIYHDNALWIAKDDGLYSFRFEDSECVKLKSDKGDLENLPSSIITNVFKDKQDRIWIGHAGGISLLDPWDQKFEYISGGNSRYSSVCRYENGFLFGSFYKNTVVKWDGSQKSVSEIYSVPEDSKLLGISQLNSYDSKILAAFYKGIGLIDPVSSTLRSILSCSNCTTYQNNQDEDIWVLDKGDKRILKVNASTLSTREISFSQMNDSEHYACIVEDKDGQIWLGSDKGMTVIDTMTSTSRFISLYHNEDEIAQRGIDYIHFQDSILWLIKARESLWKARYINDSFQVIRKYYKEDGLGDNRVTDIAQSRLGQLFVSTMAGLSVYDDEKDMFINYNKLDGLKDDVLDGGIQLLGDTLFLFGQDIQFTNINAFTNNYITATIDELTFLVNNNHVDFDDSILQLNHDENNVSIRFISILLNSPTKVEYKYRLHENAEWQYLDHSSTSINLFDLAPGDYQFEITSRNKFTDWGTPALIRFDIKKPYWNTLWFYLMCMILFGSAVYLFFAHQVRQHQKLSYMETKLVELESKALRAQMNPHFIFNSLNSIKSFIINSEKEAAADYLTHFSDLIRSILKNSREKLIPISREIEALNLYMDIENIRLENKFDVRWQIEESINIDTLMIQPLSLQPFIENAIWHGFVHKKEKGHLQLSIRDSIGQIIIEIEDDGVGREESKKIEAMHKRSKSYGILITTQRLNHLSSEKLFKSEVKIIDLYNDEGEASGTRVILKLPKIEIEQSEK